MIFKVAKVLILIGYGTYVEKNITKFNELLLRAGTWCLQPSLATATPDQTSLHWNHSFDIQVY